ncbi:hypothetical protein LX36DRAFT_208089 [Colletotrichum falcatum]|nr:hypothetical protein LX36DRAFT_208089 [Colletotrichum falcatum]
MQYAMRVCIYLYTMSLPNKPSWPNLAQSPPAGPLLVTCPPPSARCPREAKKGHG